MGNRVDIGRANMRFEYFLMQHGYDPNEPPDDRKTLDDIQRYAGRREPPQVNENWELISDVVYDEKTGEVKYIDRRQNKPDSEEGSGS